MIHLTNIKILKDFRNLKKDTNIVCEDIILLVGDQGSGKSSLLKALDDHSPDVEVSLTELTKTKGVNTYFFDSEHQNPRTVDLQSAYTTISGQEKGIGLVAGIQSRWESHGEVLKRFTVDGIAKCTNAVLFFDEPESGLSIRNQYELIKSVEKASNNGCQIFIATHCLPLIEATKRVYSLEHNCWMASDKFIETQKS